MEIEGRQSYNSLGTPDDYWEMIPMMFFGYELSEEQTPLRPLFKFNKDVYAQIFEDFETGKTKA